MDASVLDRRGRRPSRHWAKCVCVLQVPSLRVTNQTTIARVGGAGAALFLGLWSVDVLSHRGFWALACGKGKERKRTVWTSECEKDKLRSERQEFLFIIETVACFPRLMFHYALVCCQSISLA